jgi:far upstream element-binding protein
MVLGGETIREIQNATGAKINVFPPSGADHEREIDLVGSRQAIDAAERAIRGKVDALREKNDARAAGRGARDGVNDRPPVQGDTAVYNNTAAGAPMAAGAAPGTDPYAAWGGYQNYVAMWYAAMANQQQQTGQAPPGGQNRPGAS